MNRSIARYTMLRMPRVALLAILLATAAPVWAGTLFMPPDFWIANNDNANPSENQITVEKTFDFLAPIDIVAPLFNSGGVTEFFWHELILNNTGVTWTDYHLELGFGFVSDALGEIDDFDGGFIPSPPNDGLDFDYPDMDPRPRSSTFGMIMYMEDFLRFQDVGRVHPGQTLEVFFSLDVPDIMMDGLVGNQTGNDLIPAVIVRQYPTTIPEPLTVALTTCALASLGGYLKRRRTPSIGAGL